MKNSIIGRSGFSRTEYWQQFGRLIYSADFTAVLTCLGWIFFWLDQIPDHLIHFHAFTWMVFAASLSAGLFGCWIIVRTRNRLGTRTDKVVLLAKVLYGVTGSLSGLVVNSLYPPH
ncbi:MAG: hypothetical protein JSV00_07375 [bacterium]|nr:MAG: hypothetical protein JSV00_07375 [bacterium]